MAEPTGKWSRRDFVKRGAGALGSLALGQSDAGGQIGAPSERRKPNFVFILTDGHRPSALGINGNKIIQTPNLDRIGREGIRFEQAFVTNALCLPSRASALTGLYSHATGCIDNNDHREIPADIPMFTDLLREAGYEVALLGKAHVGGLGKRNWNHYFGFPSAATDYFWPVIEEGSDGQLSPPQTYDGYVDDVVTDHAVEWIKTRTKPFCVLLWMQSPHAPFFRARRHLDLYNGIPIPKPATFDDDLKGYPGKPRAFANADNKIGTYTRHSQTRSNCARSLEEVTKDYYAGIVLADENVGKVLQTLTSMDVLDDTAIVFSADHGFFLGEWRMYDKRFMHEPSIRVPLFVRYPRIVRPGRTVSRAMTLNVDWAPTFLELAGLPVPAHMHGRSLVPFLRGEQPANWRRDWLYEYYEFPVPHNVPRNRGIRTDRYKLIHYYEPPEEFELYDLERDPGELRNLYGQSQYDSLVRDLLHRIEELRRETGDGERPAV